MSFLKKETAGTELSEPAEKENKGKHILGDVFKWLWFFRKFVLAAPVVYAALRLAAYNTIHLPASVGINLQANGEFSMHILKSMAIMGPLALTGGCLFMMFLSRKALYAWSISVFSLALPVLLLVSNIYPS